MDTQHLRELSNVSGELLRKIAVYRAKSAGPLTADEVADWVHETQVAALLATGLRNGRLRTQSADHRRRFLGQPGLRAEHEKEARFWAADEADGDE